MTYRERRQRRADNYRTWAGKREATAEAVFKADEHYTRDHAFNTQPGHIPERARLIKRHDRQFESLAKASSMRGRADGIEDQLATSIYDDDPDAVEQLRARIARLETERDAAKARNAAYRKAHKAELAAMSPCRKRRRLQQQPISAFQGFRLSHDVRLRRDRVLFNRSSRVATKQKRANHPDRENSRHARHRGMRLEPKMREG